MKRIIIYKGTRSLKRLEQDSKKDGKSYFYTKKPMKSLVVYYSKTGRTRQFAVEIDKFLKDNNLDSRMISVHDVKPEDITHADIILLGCWTSGLFFILQHPDKTWKEYAAGFPEMNGKKVGFFTTYKTATGSMFRNMYKNLKDKLSEPVNLNLKSRNTKLSDDNKSLIKAFIAVEGSKP